MSSSIQVWCITIIMVLFENLQHYTTLYKLHNFLESFKCLAGLHQELCYQFLYQSTSEQPNLVWKLLMDISLLTLSSHCPPSFTRLPLSWKWKNGKISPLGNQTWIVGVRCCVGTKIWPTNFTDWLNYFAHSNCKSW